MYVTWILLLYYIICIYFKLIHIIFSCNYMQLFIVLHFLHTSYIIIYVYITNRIGRTMQKSITSFLKFKYFIRQTMNYSFDETKNFCVSSSDRLMTLILLYKSLTRLKNLPYFFYLFKIHNNNSIPIIRCFLKMKIFYFFNVLL